MLYKLPDRGAARPGLPRRRERLRDDPTEVAQSEDCDGNAEDGAGRSNRRASAFARELWLAY